MKTFNLSTLSKSILITLGACSLAACNSSSSSDESEVTPPPTGDNTTALVYFKSASTTKSASDYDDATLYVWNDESCSAYNGNEDGSDWNKGLLPTGVDSNNGVYWEVKVNPNADEQCVHFIPRIDGDKPLGEFDGKLDLHQTNKDNAVFTKEGIAAVFPELIEDVPANHTRVYFNDLNGTTSGFNLHTWSEDTCTSLDADNTEWPGMPQSGYSETYGPYWDIPTNNNKNCLNIIPNGHGEQTGNLKFEFDKTTNIGDIGFIFKGTDKVFYNALANLPNDLIELTGASAIFADANTLLTNAKDATKLELYFAKDAGMSFNSESLKVEGSDESIASEKTISNDAWKESLPHLNDNFNGFEFDFTKLPLQDLLKGQLIAVASDDTGPIKVTEVQFAKALDSLYAENAYDVELGATLGSDGKATFRLWAPTAQNVSLVPYGSSSAIEKIAEPKIDMTFDKNTGIWEASNTDLEHGDYYKYDITVYHPATDKIEEYLVTDPYSHSLSTNSLYSQVVNFSASGITPTGWNDLVRPHSQENPASFVLYESHIRDFSALDGSTEENKRGKYLAFAQSNSTPVQHLKELQQAGVTHLHLMPTFDIATINEDPAKVANIDEPFSKLCDLNDQVQNDNDFGNYCDSSSTIKEVFEELSIIDSTDNPIVQRLNGFVRDVDGFNWGYDPFHYTVPEGSYSSNAEGLTRIKEFREMVMAIKQDIKLNVVMDIVYNHTNESGVSDKSVLDKIVPWYYQRLNEYTGAVEQSTCCSNTAPENKMMAKLIKDSLVTWTKEYKIDAYRWDLMGHHPKTQILESLEAVREIDSKNYFYGEGWNYGEVENDGMFKQATQQNMYGTGVGTFSDRLRDAVRGGSPFDSGDGLRDTQGFGNGAFVLPNSNNETVSRASALHLADLTRLGMAGNLKDYQFTDSTGESIKGSELDYNGQPAGYAKNAEEIQNYVSKHDNQTLWDIIQYKAPFDTSLDDRVRMQAISYATVILGQGVVFNHMGGELLRSKSMQRDSYDSGDWYNFVDFTKKDNNWNVGLPRKDKDESNWELISEVISESGDEAKPTDNEIAMMDSFYKELLSIRSSSTLFSLNYSDKINQQVKFHNTGKDQTPGVIIMSIEGDTDNNSLVIVLNATPEPQTTEDKFDATGYQLHQKHSDLGEKSIAAGSKVEDDTISVPAWHVAVFEKV